MGWIEAHWPLFVIAASLAIPLLLAGMMIVRVTGRGNATSTGRQSIGEQHIALQNGGRQECPPVVYTTMGSLASAVQELQRQVAEGFREVRVDQKEIRAQQAQIAVDLRVASEGFRVASEGFHAFSRLMERFDIESETIRVLDREADALSRASERERMHG
jgi:hypothetical protein